MKLLMYLILTAILNVNQVRGTCRIRFDQNVIYYPEKKVNVYLCEEVTPYDLIEDTYHPVIHPVFTVNNSHLIYVYKEMFAKMDQRRTVKVVAMINSQIKNISNDVFDDFRSVIRLDLRYNEITDINFLRMIISWVWIVDLSHNNIEHISVTNLSHPRDLQALYLSFNKIITLDITFRQVATGLSTLDLSYNSITNLNENVFQSVPYLQRLSLTNCTTKRLDFKIFGNASRLNHLNISQNEISVPKILPLSLYSLNLSETNVAVDGNMFLESRRLIDLDLSRNGLRILEKQVFIHLQSLKSLYLNNNDLELLEREVFQSLNKTDFLNCASNKISKLQQDVFAELPSLRTLDLSKNGLEQIENGAFNSLPELRLLDLSENNIEILTGRTFSGLGLLLELRLNGNRLKTLSSKPFADLRSLIQLDMSNNPYHVVETYAFVGLTSLKIFNLSHQSISKIQPNAFAPFKLLSILDLSYNTIETLDKDTFNLDYKISQIWLNDNKIVNINPGAFKHLAFNTDIYFYTRMNNLAINKNGLQYLKKRTFAGISNVAVLNMDDNAIEFIEPFAFEGCTMILSHIEGKITLNNNKLSALQDDTFSGVQYLRGLELRDNAIVTVESDSFRGLGFLRSLTLSGNFIKELPLGSFRHFPNLTELQLAENFLTYFEVGFFSNLRQLKTLNVSHNNFVSLDVNILYPLKSLYVLQLDANCLSELNYSALLKYNDDLRYISVNDNKWSCSHLIEILRAFRDRYVQYLFNTTSTFVDSSIEGIACSKDGGGGGCDKAIDVKRQKTKTGKKSSSSSKAYKASYLLVFLLIAGYQKLVVMYH